MKKPISILLAVILLAAFSAPALASPPLPAPSITRVDYGPLGLDTRFAIYFVIPQYVDAFIDPVSGSGTVDLEVMYNEGDGVWRPFNVSSVYGSTPPGTMPFSLIHSIDVAPWSEFRARLNYNYTSGNPSTVNSAWSAPKRDADTFVVTSQGLVYSNFNAGYSVTLPLSWRGLFLINAGFENHVTFLNKRNQVEVYLGNLFSIAVTNGERPDLPNPVRIASGNGKTAWYSIPSGVNYDSGNSSLRNEYQRMAGDIPAIIRSFRFISGRPAVTAHPASSSVIVNGVPINFDAYNINNSNYFKLRDLAYVLSGTEAQFDVGWNADYRAITLTSGVPYTVMGGEMTTGNTGDKPAIPNASTVFVDGVATDFTAYTIESLNYFMLRDIARTFNFSVTWDSATDTVIIDTSRGYSG